MAKRKQAPGERISEAEHAVMEALWTESPLSAADVRLAVVRPAEELGVDWSDPAVTQICDRSDGFPFFVQTWAYHTWNAATDDPISAADVERAVSGGRHLGILP